jgi:drug/metabolite transporter (DMT)-like permease
MALTAMWSPSFLFIKLAIEDLPPMTVAALRISLALVVLYAILKWRNISLPSNPVFWMHATIVGLFSTALPFCLFCYAEQTIDSSLAAVLNGSVPMFTALLAQIFIPNDRLSLQKALGIACCAGGLLFLFVPNIQEGFSGTSLGMLAAITASICYAIQHVYTKLHFTGHQPFVAPTAMLFISALVLWPFALWMENPLALPVPSLWACFGIFGLAIFGTVCAFAIYYKLIEDSGPTAISLVACFFPVGGMLLGVLFLGESFTIIQIAASALILLGLAIVNQLIDFKLPQSFALRRVTTE